MISLTLNNLTAEEAVKILEKLDRTLTAVETAINETPAPVVTVGHQFTEAAPVMFNGLPVVAVGETDTDGLAWDERIHSGAKTKNADGRWKKRKGVDANEFDRISAELKGGSNDVAQMYTQLGGTMPAAPYQIPAPPMPTSPSMPMPAPAAPVAYVPPAPPMPVAPAAPVIERNYNGLMTRINQLFAAQTITPQYLSTVIERLNTGFQTNTIVSLGDIGQNAMMIEYAWQCLDADKYGV